MGIGYPMKNIGLIEKLKRDVDSHPVLSNNWLNNAAEYLSLKELKKWLSQEYFVSQDFVSWFLKTASNTNDIEIRIALVENIWEELGEGIKSNSHIEILREFLVKINFDFSNLICYEKTSQYLSIMSSIISSNTYRALGALGPANEYLLKKEYGKMYQSYSNLRKKENLPDGIFFEVNLNADEGHSKKLFDLIEKICNTNEKKEMVIQGNLDALKARLIFYEGLN